MHIFLEKLYKIMILNASAVNHIFVRFIFKLLIYISRVKQLLLKHVYISFIKSSAFLTLSPETLPVISRIPPTFHHWEALKGLPWSTDEWSTLQFVNMNILRKEFFFENSLSLNFISISSQTVHV